jgi:uncharacterized membrane protein YcaP (DUF421 family)
MHFLQSNGFTWKEFLLGGEDWAFLPEVVLRVIIMFTIILMSLAILGKRGVKQLSVFELVVIIGLGSAAGDPMFYKDVGVLPALIVFIIVVSLYIFVTHLVGKHSKVEKLIEGKPVCLVEDGRFAISNFSKEPLGQDEFFAELRVRGVSQLGQVRQAIVETSGEISVFFYSDEEVRFGLPILPKTLELQTIEITKQGQYSCMFCGFTKEQEPVKEIACPVCKKNKWVWASDRKRVP